MQEDDNAQIEIADITVPMVYARILNFGKPLPLKSLKAHNYGMLACCVHEQIYKRDAQYKKREHGGLVVDSESRRSRFECCVVSLSYKTHLRP